MLIKSPKNIKITDAQIIADTLKNILKMESELDQEKEHFWVIGLKSNNVVKYIELVHLGSLNMSIAHPREILRTAIFHSVASIIVAHNHPSGDTYPSNEDKMITAKLVKAGEIFGINILDHVIIAENGCYFSFQENNLINIMSI